MAAITRTPRSRWIEAGLRALAAGGPDAVRVEVLAQALGVTKGGFYGQFADRNALLEEMLDTWERNRTDEVLERVERRGGDVRAKLRRAGALTFSAELLPIDLAVRDWARRDQAVAERLRRVDNRRIGYLRQHLDPDGVRAAGGQGPQALLDPSAARRAGDRGHGLSLSGPGGGGAMRGARFSMYTVPYRWVL